MAKDSSATTRQRTPNVKQTTKPGPSTNRPTGTATINDALKRRAQALIDDKSITAQNRAIIRYGLEVNDPWLAELVGRVEAGENIADTFDFSSVKRATVSQTRDVNEEVSSVGQAV